MSIGSMSHVEFKTLPSHPVNFRGQGPLKAYYYVNITSPLAALPFCARP